MDQADLDRFVISRPPAWGLGALWALVTTVGFALGFYSGFFLGHFLLGSLMLDLCLGAGVGIAQRPVLRRFVERSEGESRWGPGLGSWVTSSAAGIVAGTLIVGALIEFAHLAVALDWSNTNTRVVTYALGGSFAGVLQWFILRRYVHRSAFWIPASMVGWGFTVLGMDLLPDPHSIFSFVRAVTVGGLVLGIVTSAAIVVLWNRPRERSGD